MERDKKKKESHWVGGWKRFVQVNSQRNESEMLESSAKTLILYVPQRGNVYKNPRQPISHALETCEPDHNRKWAWLTQMRGWK